MFVNEVFPELSIFTTLVFGDVSDSARAGFQYYHAGVDSNERLLFNVSGGEKARLTDAGDFVLSSGDVSGSSTSTGSCGSVHTGGQVGVQTTAPKKGLTVKATGNDDGIAVLASNGQYIALLHQQDTDAGMLRLYDESSTTKIAFNADADQNSYFNNGGNLGIGTSSPNTELTVVNSANNSDFIRGEKAGGGRVFSVGTDSSGHSNLSIRNSSDTQVVYLSGDSSVPSRFASVSGSSTSTGSFGTLNLGSTSPNIDFFAPANDPAAIRFTEGGTSLTELTYDGGHLRLKSNYANRDIFLDTPNGDFMIDSTNGNVGIGVTSPTNKL